MNFVKTPIPNEQLPVSSQRTFPTAPFPRKYVHCTFENLAYAVQAVYTLRATSLDAADIHVMASWDYIEAVERRHQRWKPLLKLFMRFYTLLDEGFGDEYLHEALQGRHILVVRLSSRQQIKQVRQVLIAHHAHLIKYIDNWTVAELSPSQQYSALPPHS